jgi:uncharacterized protein
MTCLAIPVAKLGDSPRRFLLDTDSGWWDRARETLRELEVGLREPFRLDLTGYRLGARLLFQGELRGAVELSCSRCLDPFAFPVRERVQLLLEPVAAHLPPPTGGIELDPEDLEVGRWGGDELDFEGLVSEILALVWPMQPRCREDCEGLCPVCGANRNREVCSCVAPGASHPLRGLGELLRRSKQARKG